MARLMDVSATLLTDYGAAVGQIGSVSYSTTKLYFTVKTSGMPDRFLFGAETHALTFSQWLNVGDVVEVVKSGSHWRVGQVVPAKGEKPVPKVDRVELLSDRVELLSDRVELLSDRVELLSYFDDASGITYPTGSTLTFPVDTAGTVSFLYLRGVSHLVANPQTVSVGDRVVLKLRDSGRWDVERLVYGTPPRYAAPKPPRAPSEPWAADDRGARLYDRTGGGAAALTNWTRVPVDATDVTFGVLAHGMATHIKVGMGDFVKIAGPQRPVVPGDTITLPLPGAKSEHAEPPPLPAGHTVGSILANPPREVCDGFGFKRGKVWDVFCRELANAVEQTSKLRFVVGPDKTLVVRESALAECVKRAVEAS